MKGLTFRLLGVAALTGASALALSVPLTLAQQAQKAEVIVRATLGQAQPVKEGDVTYTAYPLDVKETVAGDVNSLPQLNGKPALMFLQGLEDTPKLSAGQEAVLLLYARRLDSPVVGVNQGAYVVQNGKVNAEEITDPVKLVEAIRTARGNK